MVRDFGLSKPVLRHGPDFDIDQPIWRLGARQFYRQVVVAERRARRIQRDHRQPFPHHAEPEGEVFLRGELAQNPVPLFAIGMGTCPGASAAGVPGRAE